MNWIDWPHQMSEMQHELDMDRVLKRIREEYENGYPGQVYQILKEEGLTLADLNNSDLRAIELEISKAR